MMQASYVFLCLYSFLSSFLKGGDHGLSFYIHVINTAPLLINFYWVKILSGMWNSFFLLVFTLSIVSNAKWSFWYF
jgi:hypothetical protein